MTDRSIDDLLIELRSLANGKLESPTELAGILIAQIYDQDKTWVLTHTDAKIDDPTIERIKALWFRLLSGEPLPYITGIQAFYGLDFEVSPGVLIPRPETELLVEVAQDWLQEHPDCRHATDIGTGSGNIAVCLADEFPDLRVHAIDISPKALRIAQVNAKKHKVSKQISFQLADLRKMGKQKFDLVCANLPYIPSTKLAEVNSIEFESKLALDGGPSGLDLIQRLLSQLPSRLNTPGLALLEIEETLGKRCLSLATSIFPKERVELMQDLAGKDRLLVIER
ncbi:MAG: peptide chain release factor N(5)-glutamine methyltransferase [Anaerolineaceae bacterium]|nr:peptide chain release factor N(5)-glutamine methyltransferase [Anaerolineaceae bacterium]